MDSLGLALIVGGTALVMSGLVLLLPGPRKRRKQQETIEQSRAEIDYHLRAMRQDQDDLS